MRFLVLGGTAWLGGSITASALELGHRVTCLARGRSGSAPAGAVFVPADRDQRGAYDQVAGARWDVVVDVSRQPGQVRRAVSALAGRSKFFVFVSSGNVYTDHSTIGQDEGASLLPPLDGEVMETMDAYGQAKVACEQHVLEVARTVAGHCGPVVAARREWLLAQGVQPWMGECSLPLWVSDPDWAGFNARDSSKARTAGLVTRPLEHTLADTLTWEMTRDPAQPRRAGLSDDTERSLLQVLAGS